MDDLCVRCNQLDDLRPTEGHTASKNLSYSSSATRNLGGQAVVHVSYMPFACCLYFFCVSVARVSVAFNALGFENEDSDSQQVSLSQLAQCCLLRYYFEVSEPAQTRKSGTLARLPNQKSKIWKVIHSTLAEHSYL